MVKLGGNSVLFQRLSPRSQPVTKTESGYKLKSCENIEIEAKSTRKVPTDILLIPPPKHFLLVSPALVFDENFKIHASFETFTLDGTGGGEGAEGISCFVTNHSNQSFHIHRGDYLCEVTILKFYNFPLQDVTCDLLATAAAQQLRL
jgi:dUTPase